jgi:hypothetical protein
MGLQIYTIKAHRMDFLGFFDKKNCSKLAREKRYTLSYASIEYDFGNNNDLNRYGMKEPQTTNKRGYLCNEIAPLKSLIKAAYSIVRE